MCVHVVCPARHHKCDWVWVQLPAPASEWAASAAIPKSQLIVPACLQFEEMVREYDGKHAIYFKLHQEIQDLSTKVEGLQQVSNLFVQSAVGPPEEAEQRCHTFTQNADRMCCPQVMHHWSTEIALFSPAL